MPTTGGVKAPAVKGRQKIDTPLEGGRLIDLLSAYRLCEMVVAPDGAILCSVPHNAYDLPKRSQFCNGVGKNLFELIQQRVQSPHPRLLIRRTIKPGRFLVTNVEGHRIISTVEKLRDGNFLISTYQRIQKQMKQKRSK